MSDEDGSTRPPVEGLSITDLDKVGACAVAYAEAIARHQECETLASADDVLAARATLVECIVRTAWLRPPGVVHTWTEDLLLLQERDERTRSGG